MLSVRWWKVKEMNFRKKLGAQLPPGYQAHLGLLYLNTGRTNQALAAWEQEKKQFPESAPYIDYLVGNLKKNGI